MMRCGRKSRFFPLFVIATLSVSCGLDMYATLTPVTSFSTQAIIPQYTFNYDMSDPGAGNVQGFVLYYRIYASSDDLSSDAAKINAVNTTGASGATIIQQLKSLKYETIKFQESGTTTPASNYLAADKTRYQGPIKVDLALAWPPTVSVLPTNLGSYATITDTTVIPAATKYYQMQRSLGRFPSSDVDTHKFDFYEETTSPNIQDADEDFFKGNSSTGKYIVNFYVVVYGIEFSSITDIYSSVTQLSPFFELN
jgi:hypothetical protein